MQPHSRIHAHIHNKTTRQYGLLAARTAFCNDKVPIDEHECSLDELFNILRPKQNGRDLPDDIFECIFLNENVSITIKNSQKFVPKGPINNIPALVQIMAWRRPGDKPSSELMMGS